MRYYTGVGSRKVPEAVGLLMTEIARILARNGWCLRSGGALGSDSYFEQGAARREVYLAKHSGLKAEQIAARYHPAWGRVKPFARKLHGRNVYQVLGRDLKTPSEFLICWTPDGCTSHNTRVKRTGGTGTAISVADKRGIPVHNLANVSTRKQWTEWASLWTI